MTIKNNKLVMVLEDDTDLAEGIELSLQSDELNFVICETIAEARKALEHYSFDLLIFDINLPDGNGLEFCRELKRKIQIPIALLTAKGMEMDIVKGLESGADDYITKPFGIMELISRVKALLRRTGSSDEEKLIGIGSLFIDDEKRVAYVDDKPVELTYKEYELLKYLALNRGIVLTRDNIMDRIWSTDYEGESRTLDVHIKTLRHKLGTAGNYIKTVRNVGYFMDDEAR